MSSIRDIKRRMRSVANTGKITRAMEAVSATKMRKAQAVALAARPYAAKALELLEHVSEKTNAQHWLLNARPIEKIAVVLVTSDKGLCGVLNANVLRKFESFIEKTAEGHTSHVVTPPRRHPYAFFDIISVGRFGASYARRRGYGVVKEFEGIGDIATLGASTPISQYVLRAYEFKQYDAVYAIYANFKSVLKQESVVRQLLPLTKEALREMVRGISSKAVIGNPKSAQYAHEYKFEPSPDEILNTLLPVLVEAQLYHVLLEANASEHSARMIAMKNASENAKELLETLRLTYNNARQAGITREIAEITGGAAALAG